MQFSLEGGNWKKWLRRHKRHKLQIITSSSAGRWNYVTILSVFRAGRFPMKFSFSQSHRRRKFNGKNCLTSCSRILIKLCANDTRQLLSGLKFLSTRSFNTGIFHHPRGREAFKNNDGIPYLASASTSASAFPEYYQQIAFLLSNREF